MSATEPAKQASHKRRLQQTIRQFAVRGFFFWMPALVFIILAGEVRSNQPLPGDVAVLSALGTVAAPWLTAAFMVITVLGGSLFATSAVTVASGVLWYLRQRRNAVFLLFAVGGTGLINLGLKLWFERSRPTITRLVLEEGYSFPSGHAMISMALALTVIILVWHSRYRVSAVVAGSIYVLLIGLSRMYLGVHYPSDILAGWCVSALWILTLNTAFTRFSSGKKISFSSK